MSSNSSVWSSSYVDFLSGLTNSINNYAYVLTACIGAPLNLLSIFIFSRLMKNKTNMGFLGICQSTVDIGVLLYMLLIYRSPQVFGINFPNSSDFMCRLLSFMRRIVLHASSWMSVLTTFDRFIFIMYGNQNSFRFMKKKTYLSLIMLTIFVIIALLDIPNLMFYLNITCTATDAITLTTNFETILLRTYLPFLFMIIFNSLMIRKIFRKNQTLQHTTLSRREYQFTLAVMSYDVYFFLFNAPLSAWYILNSVYTYMGTFKTDPTSSAVYSLMGAITVNLADFIQTFSFFSYLTFNKIFRREFLSLKGRIRPAAARVSPNFITTKMSF
jgi:hypothetical protein